MAAIGFHGSSMKIAKLVAPALQVLLGGGPTGDGGGLASDKVIKLPSKRGPQALRVLLNDYEKNSHEGELYNHYYARKGKIYFYELLSPLANQETITPEDFIDWEQDAPYKTEIGVGECAGVMIDLVATLIVEGEEKIEKAQEAFQAGDYADSIYYSYTAFVNTAKALLVGESAKTNTQAGIIKDFDELLVQTGKVNVPVSFQELVYQINQQEPDAEFAAYYLDQAIQFKDSAVEFRQAQVAG
jgi:sulfite reductase (ferredoxin)